MPNALEELYDTDFYAWTQENAKAIRALAGLRLNSAVDIAHTAEEIEDLGRAQLQEIENRLVTIIQHLLKLEHLPASAPRRGWRSTVREARDQVRRAMTPTIRQVVQRDLDDLHESGASLARSDLIDFGEAEQAAEIGRGQAMSLDNLLQRDFWPRNCHGHVEPE
jgi:hypothetical protein